MPQHTGKEFCTFVVLALPPSGTFQVSPNELPPGGGQVRLDWTTRNAAHVTLSPSPGAVDSSGYSIQPVGSTTTFVLTVANSFRTLQYPLTVTVRQGNDTTVTAQPQGEVILKQNHPNPFHTSTLIGFSIPVASRVAIKVIDLLGREVSRLADSPFEAGEHELTFSGAGHCNGVYFCQMNSGGTTRVIKMLLEK